MSSNAAIPEILIGRSGAQARFRILGPTCPDATTNGYRAQLNVTLIIESGAFVGRRDMVMFADEFQKFERQLVRFLKKRAALGLEAGDFFSLMIYENEQHGLHAWLQLDAIGQGDRA